MPIEQRISTAIREAFEELKGTLQQKLPQILSPQEVQSTMCFPRVEPTFGDQLGRAAFLELGENQKQILLEATFLQPEAILPHPAKETAPTLEEALSQLGEAKDAWNKYSDESGVGFELSEAIASILPAKSEEEFKTLFAEHLGTSQSYDNRSSYPDAFAFFQSLS